LLQFVHVIASLNFDHPDTISLAFPLAHNPFSDIIFSLTHFFNKFAREFSTVYNFGNVSYSDILLH
jgi:hypothetical protein